jgi:hypothetical protein
VIVIGVLALLVAFSVWGGLPRQNVGAFWLGVGIMVAVLFAFGAAIWHLLVRPLPAGQAVPSLRAFPASSRQIIAVLLGLGGVSIIVGAFWDEVWHRRYGVPFGEDFFWRPHLMLYFGFLVVSALGFVSYLTLMRSGQGTLQQRFRSSPVMGMLIIASGFLLFALAADPLWHSIYGVDITAWSMPHLVIVMCFTSIILLSAAVHLTNRPVREWRSLARLEGGDLLPLVMFGALLTAMLQLLTTEWDGAPAVLRNALRDRPEWLLPALQVGCAGFVGALANHSLRMVGAASIAGVTAFAARALLLWVFGVSSELPMTFNAWLLCVPVCIGVDLGYAAVSALKRPDIAQPLGALVGALGMTVVSLPLFGQYFPAVKITAPLLAFAMIAFASLAASWAGARLGEYFASANKQVEAASGRQVALMSLLAFVGMVAFIVFFIGTATPPV